MNLIPNIDVAVDINSLAPVFIDHILNVNDTNSRTFSVTLYANNQKISLYSGNFTAKAAISVNNILLDDDVTALIQTDSTVAVTVDNKYLTLIPGVMKIQLTITGGNDVIVTPLPILARVTSDLAQTAQILPDSHSSYSEIVAEIVAARGDYENLSEAIESKASFVETTGPDTATENGTWYKVHTNSEDYALFAISTSAQQAQFRIKSNGTIGIRRRYLSSGGTFPAWGAFDQIGWKGSEIDDMIATYLANVKVQTITAQSTHDQIPTAKAVYDYAAEAKATGNEIKADAALVAGESPIAASLLEPYNATFTNVEYTTTANKLLMADGTIIDYNAGGVSNVVVLTPDTLYECNCAGIGGGGAHFFLYDKNDNISAIYPAVDTDSKNFVFKASDKFKKIQFNVRGSGCYLRAITLNGLEVENNFIELTNHILDTVDYTRLNISFIESKLLNDEGIVQDYAGGGTTWTVSNEIDISQYDYLKINARTGYGNAFFAIYDENHSPIYVEVSPSSGIGVFNDNVILPENAHYLVISKCGQEFDAYVSYPVFEAPTKKWEGKKWVCIGDSLTEANSATSKHYFDYIADETGITTANYGIGGTGYVNPSGTAGNFTARMASVPTDADVYTIFGSFNDYAYSINNDIPIGTPEDSGTSTICGYINSAFDALFARVPLANLGVVAPCPWVSVNSVTGTASKTFAENYVSALRQCCERKSIPFLDLYHGSGLRPWDSNFRDLTYTKDTLHGVHPDETGHAILAPKFSAFLDFLL